MAPTRKKNGVAVRRAFSRGGATRVASLKNPGIVLIPINPPSEFSPSILDWDDLYGAIQSQRFRFSETTFDSVVDHVRRNMTRAFDSLIVGDHLDFESLSDDESSNDKDLRRPNETPSINPSQQHISPQGVRTRILPTVGRAVSYVPRAQYSFEATDDPEAHKRGVEANYRRAICSAIDQAKHQELCIFATLTFDDESLNVDPLDEFVKFSRQLRNLSRRQARHLHYVAVVTNESGRPHCHALFSSWLNLEDITYYWPHGFDEIREIHPSDIPKVVRYLGKNSKHFRYHKHILLTSKGDRPPVITNDETTFDHAREQVEETVKPRRVAITSSRPFGKRGQMTYQFEPFNPEQNP